MAMWTLLRKEAPEVLDPAATAEIELLLDEILSKKSETGPVVSALAGRAIAFNKKLRTSTLVPRPTNLYFTSVTHRHDAIMTQFPTFASHVTSRHCLVYGFIMTQWDGMAL